MNQRSVIINALINRLNDVSCFYAFGMPMGGDDYSYINVRYHCCEICHWFSVYVVQNDRNDVVICAKFCGLSPVGYRSLLCDPSCFGGLIEWMSAAC